MDPLAQARQILKQIFAEHQALELRSGPDTTQSHYIWDENSQEYLIVHTGYSTQQGHRVYGVVFHVYFRDGKIWVERDSVIPSITGEMVEHGIKAELFTQEPYRIQVAEPA